MKIGEIRGAEGSRGRRKRVGRGIGSGHGKTATRGHKGQKSRGTGKIRPGFEGGQTPLHRRVRKRKGLSKTAMPTGLFKKKYNIVNIGQLERFQANALVTPQSLLASRVISQLREGVRILGKGEVTKPLRVRAHHFSEAAREKLTAAGGTIEVI